MKSKAEKAKEFDLVLSAMLTTKPLSKEEISARIRSAAESQAEGKASWPVEAVERLEGDQSLIG
jgi:hypothetical protein